MARPRKVAPDYRYHVSGQAVVSFNGTNFYLGPHNSPESQAKYRKLVAEYIASGFETPNQGTHQGEHKVSVADIAAEARLWIKGKFPDEGHSHRRRMLNLCGTLEDQYGDIPADSFGPRKLAELRELFIASNNSRKYANTQTNTVVRIFKHALSRELIDSGTLVKLQSLEPLRFGQCKARESEPVQPADIEHVRKTARHLSPTLRAMVRIQAATGMRPSEVCNMRPCEIDRSGAEWVYRPTKHKTAHHGKAKAVPLVGDARDALAPFMFRDPESYCFSPADSIEWYRVQRAANRSTPARYGNRRGTNRVAVPMREPGEKYSKDSYRRAIQRAAGKAKVPHWFPYQLRHLAGTVVRDALGVEAAQALLGHSRASMTEHYAKQSEAKAIEAAKAAPRVG